VPSQLKAFLQTSLRTLAACRAAQLELVIDDSDELDTNLGSLGPPERFRTSSFTLGSATKGEIAVGCRRDAAAALAIVSPRTPGAFACDLYAALLTEAAGLDSAPATDDRDHTRVSRMRQARRRS
jgi:hypothetical protein